MKKSILILITILFAMTAFAQGPIIKFYQFDGTYNSYSLDDIESISFANTSESLLLKIYQKNQAVQNFPAKSIDSLRYGLDNVNRQVIRFSSFGIARTFILSNVDSIVFKPLKIGDRIWMTTNLNVDHYRNGDSIPEVQDPASWTSLNYGAWCYYNNDPALGAIYGKLYNVAATLDPRGLAPEGWLIPEHDDWGDSIYKRNLKSTGTIEGGDGLWANPNTGATNESGFTALPGGIRYHNGDFVELGKSGYWGKFAFDYSYRYYFYYYSMHHLNSQSPDLSRKEFESRIIIDQPNMGFSVRCFKYFVPPSIKSIDHDTISAGDTVTIIGANFGSEKRSGIVSFNFKAPSKYLSWSDSIICVIAPIGITNGKLFVRADDEISNQIEYFVGLWSYDTVRIGNQTWMTKNLNTDHYRNGDPIPFTDPSAWKGINTGAWCYYNNDQANEGIYAKLYSSYAVNDPRGLAPMGWHVATDEDWAQLANELGGDSVAAGKLKTTGTIEGGDGLWYSPNSGATNEIGFSALPGGWSGQYEIDEYPFYYYFMNIGKMGVWWSVSTTNSCLLTSPFMRFDSTGIWHDTYCYEDLGASVRCVKGNPPPRIISMNKEMLIVGDTITIKGSAFGFQRESSYVNINDLTIADYVSWGDTEIKIIIPPSAKSGKLWVFVGGSKSNEYDIAIEPGCFKPVKICYQVWMKKNLDVDHYLNGDSIPQVTDPLQFGNLTTGAWCYYDNDPANGAIYGKLYNWYALNDPRGLAPEGWHLPTNEEWDELASCLGGLTVAGGKLKTIGTQEAGNGLWAAPNSGGTNESGFTALPGGVFNTVSNSWASIGTDGIWWSMTDSQTGNPSHAWYWGLSSTSTALRKEYYHKSNAYSVRCVRNAPAPRIDSVNPPTGMIGDTITIFGENFGQMQGGSIVSFNNIAFIKYICWSDTAITVRIPDGVSNGGLKVRVNGIWSGEFYYELKPGFPVSVKIGNQVWMTSNLNVDHYRNGDPIPEVQDITQWCSLTTGAWCYYNNDAALGETYGKLYNWYAVHDPRGLAPEGWHIPTDTEWTVLSNSLGGESVAGGKLREAGTAHWSFPNTGATNESYFSALPGGILFNDLDKNTCKGIFFTIRLHGYWWTDSEIDALNAKYRSLRNNDVIILKDKFLKNYGLSVRCIKDEK